MKIDCNSNYIDQIMRRDEIERFTGLSRSTIYLLVKKGLFPAPFKLGKRATGWVRSEIMEYMNERIRDRDKQLVENQAPKSRHPHLCKTLY